MVKLERLGYDHFIDDLDQQSGLNLIFIHGFLGSTLEWEVIADALQKTLKQNNSDCRCYGLVLPGHHDNHGQIRSVTDKTSFEEICIDLYQQLCQLRITKYIVVGYSLGGRIAFHYVLKYYQDMLKQDNIKENRSNKNRPTPKLIGCVIESSHWGLDSMAQKELRLKNDQHWANRFTNESLIVVLKDWYQQAVFADLSESQRQILIKQRLQQHGPTLAKMLLMTSLAKQEGLLSELQALTLPFCYLYGDKDSKFKQLIQNSKLERLKNWQIHAVAQAGHNIHQYQINSYLEILIQFITKINCPQIDHD